MKKFETGAKIFRSHLEPLLHWIICLMVLGLLFPGLVYGIFTQGVSPEDPSLKLAYYFLAAAVIPGSFILGRILAWRGNRSILRIGAESGMTIVLILCYFWFEEKFAVVPSDWIHFPVNYPGWHWQEWYQVRLLATTFVFTMLRLAIPPSENENTDVILYSVLQRLQFLGIASIIGAVIILGVWLSGIWYSLFLITGGISGSIALLHGYFHFTLPFIEKKQTPFENKMQKLGLKWDGVFRFLENCFHVGVVLLIGFWIGFLVILNQWTTGFFLLFGIIALVIGISMYINGPHSWVIRTGWGPFTIKFIFEGIAIGIIGILTIIQVNDPVNPPSILIICLFALGIGFFLQARVIRRYPSRSHYLLEGLGAMLGFFFFLIGIGGGLAGYYYAPMASVIIKPIINLTFIGCVGLWFLQVFHSRIKS
jgi:hypothetical protein